MLKTFAGKLVRRGRRRHNLANLGRYVERSLANPNADPRTVLRVVSIRLGELS